MSEPKPIIVKKYKNEKEYQKDAQKLIEQGYEVQSMTSERPRQGCARIVLMGFIFAFIFPPKPVLVVTYRYIPQREALTP